MAILSLDFRPVSHEFIVFQMHNHISIQFWEHLRITSRHLSQNALLQSSEKPCGGRSDRPDSLDSKRSPLTPTTITNLVTPLASPSSFGSRLSGPSANPVILSRRYGTLQ